LSPADRWWSGDDTIERRWGRKIRAHGIYRDPVRSSDFHISPLGQEHVNLRDDYVRPLPLLTDSRLFSLSIDKGSYMENGHPTQEELRRLMRFFLPLWEAKVVTDHLRDCPTCNSWYREMSAEQSFGYGVPELRQEAGTRTP
jgi:hypothetical protein